MTATSAAPTFPRRARAYMLRLWPYFSQARSAWVVALVSTVLASATEPMIPALLKPLLDQGFQGDGQVALWQVPALLLLVFGLRAGAGFLSQYGLARVINVGLERMRNDLFDKLLCARLSLFSEQNASMLANTVVYEVQNGSSLLINSLVRLVRDALTMLALAGYLLWLNWKLSLVIAVVVPLLVIVVRSLTRRVYRLTRESQSATDDLAYVVEENVLAHRDIRLYAGQQAQSGRFAGLSHQLRQLSMKSTVANSAMSALTQVLAAIALSAVVTLAILQSASEGNTVGSFVAFITAMLLLVAPLKSLAEVANPLTRSLAAIDRALALLDEVANEQGGQFTKVRSEGRIEFKAVSLRYGSDGLPALDGVSLEIHPGQTIALVGGSGSGKTSLVSLLPRFLECSEGRIELDGVDLRQWDLACLRRQFGYVSQHVVMLNDTLAANVALGQVIDRERVQLALQTANLGPQQLDLPQGLETVLGHNAMQLSGGQRQRLAIARAIYKDAPVLVLDEATSALDTESEQAVQQALERLRQGRTFLVVAHRLSTIRNADRIVVLDAGRIVETGTHDELLARGATYSHLHQLGFKSPV
jgi:subfamily B ATP-binding cassette protein MsbA